MTTTYERSLYDPAVYQDCLDRLNGLTPDSRPHWGTMTVAQMLAHCAEIQEVANGKPLRHGVFMGLVARLIRGMVRKLVLSADPFPKSTRTHPQYVPDGDRDFEQEKRRLLTALDTFKVMDPADVPAHPIMGPMSPEERGWAAYKHLDHHLTQFGV